MREQDVPASEIVVVGDSSGAAIALAMLLRCRDEGLALPAGVVLLTPAPSMQTWNLEPEPDGPFARMVRAFWKGCVSSYLAGHPADDPLVSPLLGDLRGLPPLLIQAGTRDLALGEARALHERAIASGVSSELQLYDAEAHSFHLFWSFLPEALDAIEATATFIRELVATAVDHARATKKP